MNIRYSALVVASLIIFPCAKADFASNIAVYNVTSRFDAAISILGLPDAQIEQAQQFVQTNNADMKSIVAEILDQIEEETDIQPSDDEQREASLKLNILLSNFLSEHQKCLNNKSNSAESCNKLIAMYGLLTVKDFTQEFGSRIYTIGSRKQSQINHVNQFADFDRFQ